MHCCWEMAAQKGWLVSVRQCPILPSVVLLVADLRGAVKIVEDIGKQIEFLALTKGGIVESTDRVPKYQRVS